MATFSFQQLHDAVLAAGGSEAAAQTLAAIALAESGGRSSAEGDLNIPGSDSVGPWQINLPYHPDVSRGCAMDLNCAAAAALRISSGGTNFGAWTTYTGGQYRAFLNGAGQAAASAAAGAQDAAQAVADAPAGLFGLPASLNPLSSIQAAITSSVSRAIYFFAGLALLTLGLLLLVVSALPRQQSEEVLETSPLGVVGKAVSA